jgi:hypothetical protein
MLYVNLLPLKVKDPFQLFREAGGGATAGCRWGGITAYLARGFSTGAFWASTLPMRPRQVSNTTLEQREVFLIMVRFSPWEHFWLKQASVMG